MTNKSAGSNYAQEVTAGPILPVRPDLSLGPFQVRPSLGVGKVVLIKSHCAHYCDQCFLHNFTVEEFGDGCRRAFIDFQDPAYYRPKLIKRAVHLFRNPFDNLVARKHHGAKSRVKKAPVRYRDAAFTKDTRQGFLAWCKMIDDHILMVQGRWHYLNNEIVAQIRSVPCGAEIYRYVQWHNLAIEVVEEMEIPVLFIHYEDYAEKFNETIAKLVDFWNVTAVAGPNHFVVGKSYLHLFSKDHQFQVARMVRRFASPKTWSFLERYFPAERVPVAIPQ